VEDHSDRREVYRVEYQAESYGLAVTLETGIAAPIEAEIVDLSRRGAALRLVDRQAPELRPGADVLLTFRHGAGGDPIPIGGQVRSVIATPGYVRVGIRFCSFDDLTAHLPGHLLPLFNRRVARRVRPEGSIVIELRPRSAAPVPGLLRDISWSGMNVAVDARADTLVLEREERIGLHFVLPRERAPLELVGQVQRGLLVDTEVRYGIRFDEEATPDFKRQQLSLKRYVARRYLAEQSAAKKDPDG
jgi:hypothetical protein